MKIYLKLNHESRNWGVDAECDLNEEGILDDFRKVSEQADKVLLDFLETDKQENKHDKLV